MFELSLILGLIVAGGIFAFTLDGDDENNSEIEDQEDFQSDEEFIHPNDDETLSGENAEHLPPEVAILSIDSAEWVSEEVPSLDVSQISSITDSTEPLNISDGSASELINLSNHANVIVYSGEGDTVFGGETGGAEDIFVSLSTGGAQVIGGDSDGIFLSSGQGDDIFAGAGHDFLLSGIESSTLDGGDGNDTIFGSYSTYFESSSDTTYDELTDGSTDVIYGGRGDDLIYASSGDVVSTGQGSDVVNVFGAGAVLTDFDPVEDRLTVTLENTVLFSEGEDFLLSQFNTVEENEQISVYFKDTLIVKLSNSETLDIGLRFGRGETAELVSILSGEVVEDAAVLIVPYSSKLV
ncbi:MAG: calcium-binding protein [Tateyamaria sp.]|uniref:calcium-binding protein n=1 Tax=Alphaproteobacteria TaxID=28211 RepID=UPI00329184BD